MKDHRTIMAKLYNSNYQAYVVGGAVRDSVLGLEPKDFDIATNAAPSQLLELFDGAKAVSALFHDVVYVPTSAGLVEVATMRKDGDYLDARRPDTVEYTDEIEEDLSRRDFTCNAMAMTLDGSMIDPFDGRKDLEEGILRAVGCAYDRLSEHPVRMLRAVRFASKYNLVMDTDLFDAILMYGLDLSEKIPDETVGEEIRKGLDENPRVYLELLEQLYLLPIFLPRVSALNCIEQNIYHEGKDVFEHTLDVIEHAPEGLARVAAMLHDVGKPVTQEFVSEEYGYSFIGHEELGAEMADIVCRKLKLTNEERRLVVTAVREHMSAITSPRTARRFLKRCGDTNTAMFVLDVICADKKDRKRVLRIRELVETEIEKQNAFKVTDLAINGNDVMEVLGVGPGERVGDILSQFLEMVMEDPKMNTREELLDLLQEVREDNEFRAVG